jgi:hypothetical protein
VLGDEPEGVPEQPVPDRGAPRLAAAAADRLQQGERAWSEAEREAEAHLRIEHVPLDETGQPC